MRAPAAWRCSNNIHHGVLLTQSQAFLLLRAVQMVLDGKLAGTLDVAPAAWRCYDKVSVRVFNQSGTPACPPGR